MKKIPALAIHRRFLIILSCFIFCLIFLSIGYTQEDNIDEMVNHGLLSLEARISSLIEENISLKQKLRDWESPEQAEDNLSLDSRDKISELSRENYSLSKLSEEKNQEIGELKTQLAELSKEAQGRQEAEDEQSNAYLELKDKLSRLQQESELSPQLLEEKNQEIDQFKTQLASLSKEAQGWELEKVKLEAMLSIQDKYTQAQELRQPELAAADKGNLDKDIHLNLGFAYGMKGDTQEAIRQYQKALEYAPEDKDIHYNLGYLLSKKNKYKEAVEEYKKSIKGLKQDREAYYNIAIIYTVGLKDQKTGAEYYQKFLNLSSVGGGGLREAEEAHWKR